MVSMRLQSLWSLVRQWMQLIMSLISAVIQMCVFAWICVCSRARDLCVAALWSRQLAPWSLQLLVPAKTQEASKPRAHIMHTGFTAGTDLNSQRYTTHSLVQKLLSHTLTLTQTPAWKQRILTNTHTHTLTMPHHASKSGGNLTVKARWIAVDSQQETSYCWLFLFWGVLWRTAERQRR